MEEKRLELGAFLKAKRARISPLQAGFPDNSKRRTPGLRREEVAMLAGIGTTWYTWLEQARPIGVSEGALLRITQALRLNALEAKHLFLLAGVTPPIDLETTEGFISTHLFAVLDHMPLLPAYYLDDRWNILAWNKASSVVFIDFAATEGLNRNLIWLMFHHKPYKDLFTDWTYHAHGLVCRLRAHYVERMDNLWLTELIHKLKDSSGDFLKWWNEHDIHGMLSVEKELNHPVLGTLHLNFQSLEVTDNRKIRLILHTPKEGTDSLEKIRTAVLG